MLLRRLAVAGAAGRPRTRTAASVHHRLQHGLGHQWRGKGSRRRFFSSHASGGSSSDAHRQNIRTGIYILTAGVGALGLSYAAVPLYQVFCQATGFGGTTQEATYEQASRMVPVAGAKPIRVEFSASTTDTLPWKFKPQQREVFVVPGETALAFYTASNTTAKPVTGVATYNVVPVKAGLYFNKIQCFCFDEQRLQPGEEVDMPVFFYVSPEILDDPQMRGISNICLSYTFFPAKTQEDDDE